MMYASVCEPMSFSASAIAIETAPPIAKLSAMETAAVVALIDAVSCALIETESAEIPVAPSPSMYAWTRDAILLTVCAPAPAPAKPIEPPAIAIEPAATTARIVCVAAAESSRSPLASTLVSDRYALTWFGPSSTHFVVTP